MLKKVKIKINQHNSWQTYIQPEFTLFFSGYLLDCSAKELLSYLNLRLNDNNSIDNVKEFIESLRGHFALIVNSKKFTFAAVDQVCSIPIYFIQLNEILYLSNQASLLKDEIKKEDLNINEDALLEIKMSGCTISEKTLVDGLFRLDAGNYVFFEENSELKILNYYKYWDSYSLNSDSKNNFDQIIKSVFLKYISLLNERQIIVPLSGGYDSRLIVSLLYEFNYKNVICFTFGKKNSFEFQAARKITNRLNYKWVPIYQTKKLIRKYIKSEHAKKYYSYCESFSNPPSMLDAFAIHELLKKASIEKDAVVINGNTGDFISGGHIPQNNGNDSLIKDSNSLGLDASFLKKHFSLWESYRNTKNDKKMISKLNKVVARYLDSHIPEYMIYETLEVLHRQSKLILSMQRVYEFNNLSWAIPFWDREYIKYWANMPLQSKLNSRHYREQLLKLNYGGVWRNIPINKNKIPLLIRLLRLLFMTFFIFSNREKWKKFDKKWFYYFYEDTANIGLVDYRQIIADKKGYRNALSWRALNYINRIKL